MSARRLPTVTTLILLLAASAVECETPAAGEPVLPVLESGQATLVTGAGSSPIAYSRTSAGPLFALQPIVARLGGSLVIGPLGQAHELAIEEQDFLFGIGSWAMTHGEEIVQLSQPPAAGAGGLHVPLDLLRLVYGERLGFDFAWEPEAVRLTVARTPPREVPVRLELVHLQGVSTLVLQFPFPPRFRIERSQRAVQVELIGDRLRDGAERRLAPDPLVQAVEVSPQRVVVRLAPGTVAEDYILQDPFRLVFDVYRGTGPAAATIAPPRPRQRGTGIRTIVLDPGHGGENTGAIGPGGATEKDLTLRLAQSLRSRLESRMPVKVVLTRGEDADLPLDTRTAVANQQKADLFISLHLNSSPTPGAQGAETYFSSLEASDELAALAAESENRSGGEEDPLYGLQLMLWDLAQSRFMAQSQRLAALIQEELNLTLDLRNRGVKQAPFRVLLGAAMPAVLVELGFLNNPREEARLLDPGYQAELVEALVRAVSRYRSREIAADAADEEAVR